MSRRSVRYVCLIGLFLTATGAVACGGGEEMAPTAVSPSATPAQAPQPTATARSQPSGTVSPQVTASTVVPQPTPTPQRAPTPTTRPAQPVGKLIIALANLSTENLDPTTTAVTVMWSYGAALYDWALWHATDGDLAPGVFEKWEQATDAMSWTFTLRSGMQFHNGAPVTAEDVKFNLERVISPEATATNTDIFRGNLASVAASGTGTLAARLKQPWPLMPTFLAAGGAPQEVVYPKGAFQQAASAKAFFESPIGTGPFKFSRRQTGIRMVFEAAESKHPFRPQPAFQAVEFLAVPEESTRAAMLRTGAADIVAISPEGLPALKQAGLPILQLPELNAPGLHFWGLDNPEGMRGLPTANVRVREALHLAVNKQEIVDTLLLGFGTVTARETAAPGTEGFDPSWKPVPYDPERAKVLLAEAGYSRGFTQKIYNPAIPGFPWTVRVGEAIAGYWAAIGVQAEIIPIEYGAWQPMFREKPHKRALGAYGWISWNKKSSPLGTIPNWYRTGSALQLLSDPQLDRLIDQGLTTTSAEERVQLIRKIIQVVFDAQLSIPIAQTPELYGASPKIEGWDPIRIGGPGLSWESVRRK